MSEAEMEKLAGLLVVLVLEGENNRWVSDHLFERLRTLNAKEMAQFCRKIARRGRSADEIRRCLAYFANRLGEST